MSNKKDNQFSKLYDYFNGDEDSEVEIENYEDNYNKMIEAKNKNKNYEIKNKEILNSIIDELYSNIEEEEDDDENDVFYYKEKKNLKNDENDFNNFKFTSFKPKNCNNDDKNEENENKNETDNIIQKDILNNESNKKNEETHKKSVTEQISLNNNINDIINRSTSLQSEKLDINDKEYLIDSKIFDELEKEDKKKEKIKNKIEWKDKNVLIKRNIQKLKLYMKKNIKKEKNNNNKKIKELILYEDAIKNKKKYENIERNTITEINLNSKRSKINKKSYKICMKHDDKKIESIIKEYNNELLLIDISLIFKELKIFRNLLENININKLKNINDINEFINKISIVIKDNEKRKKKELEFLKQTWYLLNNNKNYIDNEIFEGYLKILFSSLGNINDTLNIIKQYLKVCFFGEKNEINLNDNIIKECIINFFDLKKNIIAYKNTNEHSNDKYKKMIKENEKNLTFTPNIIKNENYNTIITKKKKNFNFNTLYDRFIQKEKDKQNNIQKLKKERIKKEMEEVKKKPLIYKYNNNNNIYNEEEIHEKLYNQGKYINKKKKEKILEKEKEEKEKLEKELKKYKLNYNSEINKRRMNKSFDIKIKPKGYNEYIIRNRKEILNKEKLKEKKEKISYGENYEKLKRRAITPFNITDMKKKIKKNNDDYFIMKIKIPNGQMKSIKINIESDPYKIANEFCKVYSIKENMKQKLIKNIINCQNTYLNVNKYNINNYDNYEF